MTNMDKSAMKALDRQYKQTLFKLMVRMSLYYAIVFGILALLLKVIPGLLEILPVGGISEYSDIQALDSRSMESMLLDSDGLAKVQLMSDAQTGFNQGGPTWLAEAISLFMAMVSTLVLMIPVSWVFRTIHTGHDYDHSIDETAMILPAVVAGVVTVVQHSLALAFSLAGIVAGVRFRRALNDTFDTLFIFVAIGVGLAAGVGSVEIAVVITVFFNYTTLLVCSIGEGLESKYVAIKKTTKQEIKAKSRIERIREAQNEAYSEAKPENQ